jgi:NADH:ubiquinone oxidoreductase subunit 1 (chain H)
MLGQLALQALEVLVFPGLAFLALMGLLVEFADRKIYARLQNRVGPPIYQPLADFVKLGAKQEIIPREADRRMFKAMPIIAPAAVAISYLYLPIWGPAAPFSFEGDLIVVLYLLMIPTLAFFLGAVYSTSLFASIGALRIVTQLFAYEVPLFLALLSPAILSGSWSVSGIAAFFSAHPGWAAFDILGFAVAVTACLGKLEKAPFDIAEAETEIVGGVFTEYSGRMLALFHLAVDMEFVVVASLLSAVFIPFGLGLISPLFGFVAYLAKLLFVVALISILRTVMARLRIDQMIEFCWKYLAPLAFLQVVASIVLKGALG